VDPNERRRVSATYTGLHLNQGSVGIDSGTLGQMAERVFRGQVPFRDFTEMYRAG
jgi:hypothetical protein